MGFVERESLMSAEPNSATPGKLIVGELAQEMGALPKVELPGDNSLLLHFARKLGSLLHDKGIYQRGEAVVHANAGQKRLELMQSATFCSWVEVHMVCYRAKCDRDGNPYDVLHSMNTTMSEGVLMCVEFRDGLPRVERVNPVPKPGFIGDGEMTMPGEGYAPDTQTLTFV